MKKIALVVIGAVMLAAGCEAPYHSRSVRDTEGGDKLTVGVVQREIKQGMSGADVASAMGSPNIVTSDGNSGETWIYDKMATEVVSSGSSWFVRAGAARQSQKTLTVVIKFDADKRVRQVAYHQSSF